MAKKVFVDISPTGTVKIDVQGASGRECEQLTGPLHKLLGGQGEVDPKPEYYQAEQADEQIRYREQ